MNAENILQSKLNKVKSFIDNESFVFTFSKTNAFAIHKDQLFKNQIYKTYIDHNGYEINERKNSPVIKNEKIIQISDNNILFNSSRIVIKDMGKNIVYEPKESEFEINSKKFKIKENISKIDNANGKIFYNDDNKIKSIDILNLNNLTIHFEDKDKPFTPFKLYKSTIPFDIIRMPYAYTQKDTIYIDNDRCQIDVDGINLEYKKHIIFCLDVNDILGLTINNGEQLINHIVETSESESNFKFDRASEEIYSDDYYGDTIKFYNDEYGSIKVASIKKKCTSMNFYYKITSSSNFIYLYIDGNYYNEYSNNSYDQIQVSISNLTNEEHEFTWVLYNNSYRELSIDTISFNNEDLTDSSLVTNDYDNDIFGSKYINNEIKENIINNIIKVDNLGFYKISKSNNDKKIYLYIDYGNFNNYDDNSFYCRCIAGDIKYNLYPGINLIETEATEIYIDIFQNRKVYFSVLTDNHIFNKNELIKYNKDQASIVLYSDEYKNGSNSSTPFYNDAIGSKVVSIKKTCSKMSFYCKTYYSYVYLYIDGKYYNKYSNKNTWTLASIDNLTNKEHEFTWVLYNTDDHDYSCIDTISFNDVVETDSSLFSNTYDNELRNEFYKNGDNSSTPFYNNTKGIKIVSIKKTCSKMSFYYKTRYYNNSYNYVYLYIDGNYYNKYSNSDNTWTLITVDNLSNKEHEFTWVLYNTNDYDYSCIDTISFNDVVETDSNLFSNTYDNELKNINSTYKNGSNSSTSFYNDAVGSKVVSIKKTCSKMSFYCKTYYSYVYLYIDGKYYNKYSNSDNTWTLASIDNLTNEEHEFTWVLYNYTNDYYSCIDTISFNDVVETDSSLFSNTYDNELKNINSEYKNGNKSSTPFYNNTIGFKVVSIKKTCSKMSFYYKTYSNSSNYNYIYLYIDGNYYNKYSNSDNTWTLITVDNLSNKEHEFTWVLYNANDGYYSCIDTISFDDVVETDSNLFSNKGTLQLPEIANNSTYKNGSNSSTPFYNDAIGSKVVSIKKTCSKMSFYYKTKDNNSYNHIYLYIDGNYYNRYSCPSWISITVNNLTNKEHEFTWVLFNYTDYDYSCIDTISFNDVVETNSNLFSNTYDNELKNINSTYKNGNKSSTPFYNNTIGFKVVSIKKTCSKMSFYYKTKNNSSYYTNNYIYLYIDGNYYDEYRNYNPWISITVNNLSNKEHEFTWVLYNADDDYYLCIDTISFDDVVETDSNLFSNTYDNELKNININSTYKNGSNSSTPFYNDAIGSKVVSIKKTCSKMSFYYKTRYYNNSYSYVYLYIDGKYYNKYSNKNTWTLASIDNLTNEEHEFTWVLYNYTDDYYSCIDTISFNDVVETNSNLFSNTYDNELKNINSTYKNGNKSSTPFYNNTIGFKVVSIKKTCSKMSFYYKTRYYNDYSYSYVYLYIDGKYYNKYSNKNTWTLASIDNLTNKEHEFTWVLYNTDDYGYSCIDTISFNDVVETDSNLFSNTYDNELQNEITVNPFYFYNNTTGFKIVSIKKTCSKMSFYYKTKNNYHVNNCIYLYIDGNYYNEYSISDNTWTLITVDNLSNEEHEFTWVLYNYSDSYYSCIDTISFNDVVETDSSLFSNNIESFNCKNENYIEVQSDSKIIDFCACYNLYKESEHFLYYIDNNYNLYRYNSYNLDNDRIVYSNENIKLKNILNVQNIEYWDYSNGIINILFLLDKNNILKILIDDQYTNDPYYDGTIYDELFPILEEEFKDKEIKDIVCDNLNNDRIVTIYILTKSGEVYEWSTDSYESDDSGISSIIYERIKYDNIRFVAMKKTEYGIILLGEDGKLYVKGKFVNGEFGLYNTSSITIDGKEYSKAFVSDKLVRISRDEYLEDGEYKLRNIYTLKLYNTDVYDSGVYVVKEDGKLYYTGKNNGACGEVFGYPLEAQNIDVWTPVENNANDIGRISTPRPDYWSYYFDYIMKSDKNGSGNSVENIFFKIDDVWIDWNAYISKYMNVTLRDADNKILKKYKEFKKTDNSTLRKVINFDSFIEYLKLNKESITNEFKVDRTLIPQVDYIDKDLNVYTINAGDNISCIKYSQKDIDLLNADLIESLNHNIQLKNEYEDVIEKSQDPEEIFEYQNRLAVIELNIKELNKEIANNQDKLGTMNPNNYFDFNDNRIFNPMTVVDTEEKTINYSKSNFSEPNENGEIKIETEEIDGALHVVKSTVSKTVESNITKLKIDLINYDRLNNSSISDAEVLRDDIKMTIMEDPNDERNFEVNDLLVWLNGKFITKDYIIGNDNKAFCNYNGLVGVETRRICEFPGYGEPTQNSNNIPTITGENATVIEPTVPTELRWNLSPKVFSWEDVKINGPYKIHDLNNVNSELRRVEFFYFGDVYCSVFTQFLIKNKICLKNTFILFFNGAVVPEDEYDVSIKGNNTYITLKKFTAYVTSLLQDEVDIMKPGYEGRVRHILSQFDNMSQFSIAFLSSTDKFKKVKMYYDYQTIRDVPKPGQVLFNDIKYNDLILFDGRYIPYLWESRHCIRIPETVDTIRTSENNFIRHSTICRARPYSTYKKESELTDTECRMYAKQNGLINDEELSSLDIAYIRERVKPHIEARIKEI